MKPAAFWAFLFFLPAPWAFGSNAPLSSVSDSPQKVSLQQCLQIAFEDNPDLRTASTQFLAAEGRVIKLHAILYPTLNAQAISTPTTFYVQFQQTLYSHATFPQLKLSRLSESQASINYEQVLNDVVFQVRQAFTNALGAEGKAGLLREYTDRETIAVTSAQQLFEAGKIEKSAVLSIQVKSNLAKQKRDLAELEATQARLALDNLLGRELAKNTRLVGDFIHDAPSRLNVGELTAEALRNRPDLKLLESLQLSSGQQIEIDQKNAWPIIGISSDSALQPPAIGPTGNYDLERNYNEPTIQRQEGSTQLPVSLYATWRILDGGKLEGVKISDQAQLASREVALTQLKQSIPAQVAAAVTVITSEHDALQTMNAEVSPEELRHSVELDYEAGRVRQLDKVDLEDAILLQQQLRLNSEIRLSLATAALDHALGRGLQTSPPTSGP
jgi:outer membrane protein TolC